MIPSLGMQIHSDGIVRRCTLRTDVHSEIAEGFRDASRATPTGSIRLINTAFVSAIRTFNFNIAKRLLGVGPRSSAVLERSDLRLGSGASDRSRC